MKKVQLYSGGLDSYIISKIWKPDVKLYFNYGTEQNKQEMAHLPSDVIIKDLPIAEYMQNDGMSTIPLRNLIFAALAVNYGDEILIGGLASDFHYDKTEEFVIKMTELFNSVLTKEIQPKRIKIVVPFKKYTKTEMVYNFLKDGGTIAELDANSFSCYTPVGDKPCGKCGACRARKKAYKEAEDLIREEE